MREVGRGIEGLWAWAGVAHAGCGAAEVHAGSVVVDSPFPEHGFFHGTFFLPSVKNNNVLPE